MKCALESTFWSVIVKYGGIVDNEVTIPRREAAAEQELPRGFAKAELKNKDRTTKKEVKTSDISSIMRTSSERDDRQAASVVTMRINYCKGFFASEVP
jgi:hypothetical protein